MNKRYTTTALCAQGAGRKRQKLTEEESRTGAATALRSDGQLMETVTYFKYLVRLITVIDDD